MPTSEDGRKALEWLTECQEKARTSPAGLPAVLAEFTPAIRFLVEREIERAEREEFQMRRGGERCRP